MPLRCLQMTGELTVELITFSNFIQKIEMQKDSSILDCFGDYECKTSKGVSKHKYGKVGVAFNFIF